MAVVHKVCESDDKDPIYEVVGIITMEDVIEEIIRAEIVDETDVYTDNRKKQLNLRRETTTLDLSLFSQEQRGNGRVILSPQLLLAAHRFLLSEVEPFRLLSDKVVLVLLKQDVVFEVKIDGKDDDMSKITIYQRQKPSDYFVLILEGQVKVNVGDENLLFLSGPFTFYGVKALQLRRPASDKTGPQTGREIRAKFDETKHGIDNLAYEELPEEHENSEVHFDRDRSPFCPDYTLEAVSDLKFIKITRMQYLEALRATRMAQEVTSSNPSINISLQSQQHGKKTLDLASMGDPQSISSNAKCLPTTRSNPDFLSDADHEDYHRRISSDQLMAAAAKYSSVTGDRVHHSGFVRRNVGDMSRFWSGRSNSCHSHLTFNLMEMSDKPAGNLKINRSHLGGRKGVGAVVKKMTHF